MPKELLVDFEFYQEGEVTSWLQNSFTLQEEETPYLSIFDQLFTWVEENHSDQGIPRITKIWQL